MKKDVIAYVAMSIFGAIAVFLFVVGTVDIVTAGMFTVLFAVIIVTTTSVKRAIINELKEEIKRLSKSVGGV